MSRPLKLLHAFSTFKIGGPQMRFADLAHGLGADYEHHIVAMDNCFDAAERVQPPVELHLHELKIEKTSLISLQNIRRFRALMDEIGPDLVLTYNWGAMEWVLVNRLVRAAPHLHFEDGFGPDEAGGAQRLRRVLARRLAFAGGPKLVAPSQTLARIAREAWRLRPDRVLYIPNGVETARFEGAAREVAARSANVITIGSLGALRTEKNFARAIRVCDAMGAENTRLIIYGDGEERGRLEGEIARRGLVARMALKGYTDAPETALAEFDIFLLTSDTEQMPISLLEAMAAGLPVVASDVGDVAEILPPEQADFVIPQTDEADFVSALRRLIADPALRSRLGAANRARAAERFEKSKMITAYDRLFRATARRRG